MGNLPTAEELVNSETLRKSIIDSLNQLELEKLIAIEKLIETNTDEAVNCKYQKCERKSLCCDYCEEHFKLLYKINLPICDHIENNKICGKRNTKAGYCKEHYIFYENNCKEILKNGDRKGKRCRRSIHQKGYCYNHFRKYFVCKKCNSATAKGSFCLVHYNQMLFIENSKKGCVYLIGTKVDKKCGKEKFKGDYCRSHNWLNLRGNK